MWINIYDCPTWDSNQKKGKLIETQTNAEYVLLCDSVLIKGELWAIYRKVFNVEDASYEIWVEGEIK